MVDAEAAGTARKVRVDGTVTESNIHWAGNVGKRLVRSPRTYVRDSGIVHTLLGLPDLDAVLGHPVAGGSWEGFVLENLLAAAPAGAQAWFYRTAAGAEIDLLLEIRPGDRWAIEITRSSAPSLTRGFRNACEDTEASHRLVVYPGDEAFPIGHRVRALGLLDTVALLRSEAAPPETPDSNLL